MVTVDDRDVDGLLRRPERDITDLLGRAVGAWRARDAAIRPAVDVAWSGDEILLRAELPGVAPEDVDLSLEGRVLSIRAGRRSRAPEGAEHLLREIRTGTFRRRLGLPDGADPDGATASLRDGVLEIRIPCRASSARRIPVRGSLDGRTVAGMAA